MTKEKTESSGSWIGIDESGKGDYFGPLVVAGVYVEPHQVHDLVLMGIKDSKQLSDQRALALARELSSHVTSSLVVIGPKRYNELYEKMKNLNKILAWAHARVLENILQQVDCSRALSDQFGDERFILNALLEKGKKIELEQRPKAESDPAVAAASILARAEFLKRLQRLSQEVGITLPKGASKLVEDAARSLIKRNGPQVLQNVAKWHFRTTQAVLDTLGRH
ncbi:MAG: ribonuclease HIII [Nitrospira sp.]|nr:ribonuclease HIII [Nitrospira sp.]